MPSISKNTGRINVPDISSKLRKLVQNTKPNISIHLESCQKTYSTMDSIRGTVTIKSTIDTGFDEIEIQFVGTSRTYVESSVTTSAKTAGSETYRSFLRLSQPGLELIYPVDHILKAGQIYTLPFVFAVPQRLLEGMCIHSVSNQAVRNAHLQLPPTFGDQELSNKDGNLDDMSPDMASITYSVFVRILKLFQDGEESKSKPIVSKTRSLRVVPAVEALPPLDVEGLFQTYARRGYSMRKEKQVKKGILKGRLGTLIMEAVQPNSLQLPPPIRDSNCHRVTTIATVMLRFEPAEGVSQAPRLAMMTSKLKVHTYFASTVRHDFPKDFDGDFDASGGMYSESLDLASRTVNKVEWRIENPTNPTPSPSRGSVASVEQSWIPAPGSSYKPGEPFHVARTVVPIELPTNKSFVPTFHSCLTSRTYTLALYLSLQAAGLGESMELRLPLQISAKPSSQYTGERQRPSAASTAAGTDPQVARPYSNEVDYFAVQRHARIAGDAPPGYFHDSSGATRTCTPAELQAGLLPACPERKGDSKC